MGAPLAAPIALACVANPSGVRTLARRRRRRRFGQCAWASERPLKLLQSQEFERGARRVPGSHRHRFKTGFRIDGRTTRDIAEDRVFEKDPPAGHAAVLRSNFAQTVVSASMS